MDPHSGEYYYYNVDTGEQSWDIPEALGGDKVPTWVKVYDPTSISYYYFNNFRFLHHIKQLFLFKNYKFLF